MENNFEFSIFRFPFSLMQFGDYRIEIIPDTEFSLDGGAMFGVVPRVLWERKCPPDKLNRIRMNMNCLFIETPAEKILVETGIGEKWSEKELKMYGINRQQTFAETLFDKTGYRPEDITIVVNTHLHFDHAGGNTIKNYELKIKNEELGKNQLPITNYQSTKPQFPNARYFVSESEFKHAENPHERDRASYLGENWQPLIESGQLELKPDDYEVIEGLTLQTIRGHSETMQTVKLERGGKTLYGFADLIPMKAHISLTWIAGFDLFPLETLEAKKTLIKQAVEKDWICLFYHDFETPLCRLAEIDGKIKAVKISK
jgi:glyoxylase-like metal-dependent hydrolase (beta-lactamase superfamily II)